MANTKNSLSSFSGLSSLGSAGSLSNLGLSGRTSKRQDLTPDELVTIAKANGGAVGQVAMELAHPERSILSTVGDGFKNAFRGFIDIISTPSEIVAGIISPNFTVGEAIDQNKRVSDAIFGDTNIFGGDEPTTLQKVGNFAVRLPFDIVTDPITYVSFGAVAGILGLKSLPKINIGEKIIKKLDLVGKADKTGGVLDKALSGGGGKVLSYLKNIERQITGKTGIQSLEKLQGVSKTQKAAILKKGTLTEAELDFTEQQLKNFLKETTESPLNISWAKRSMTNLLEHNPALTSTILDKGGFKFFGKTLLSGQRISAVTKAIPGMTLLDDVTFPLRMSVASRFDTSIRKVGDKYIRLPGEVVEFQTQLKNLGARLNQDTIRGLQNVQKELGLNNLEWDKVYDAIINSKPPADPRLLKAYLVGKNINTENKELIESTIGAFGNMENHVGTVFIQNDVRAFRGSGKFSQEIGTTKTAKYARYIAQDTEIYKQQLPKIKEIVGDIVDEAGKVVDKTIPVTNLVKRVRKAKSMQEVGFAIGEELEDRVVNLTAKGLSIEASLLDDEVKKLFKMREEIGNLRQSAERTGKLEDFDLTSAKEGDAWTITSVDDAGKITTYKRVQADAKVLKRELGFDNIDTNLMTILTHQSLQNQKQLIGQHYMEGMVRMFAKTSDEAPESWVKIDHNSLNKVSERINIPLVTKDGRDYVFHPAVAKDFEEMLQTLGKDEMSSKFWEKFDDIQRYWKASVTSIFPMFHGRNAISNVLQNFLDLGVQAFNPRTHVMATNMIYNDRIANGLARKMLGTGDDAIKAGNKYNTLMAKEMFTDSTGYKWTYGELRNVAKDNDIAFSPNLVGMMDVRQDPDKILTGVFGVGKTRKRKFLEAVNPFDVDTNLATRAGREVGRTIEEQARLLNFISNLNKTGDVLHAAARTKMFLFDYQNLTKFEKNTMRRLIPFYTWTRKNLELQARTVLTTPGRIASELKIIRGVGDILGGGELTSEEKKLLPSWMANTIAFKRGTKDGKTEILSGFGTPIEQPFQAFQPNALLGSVSPLFRYPVEVMTGYQFFRGKPTSNIINAQNFDQAPDAIKDFIGYGKYEGTTKKGEKFTVSYSLRPGNMHLINNLPFIGRIGNVLGQMTNASVSEQLRLLQTITGVNVRTYNFEQLQRQQENLIKSEIEKKMTDAGVGGTFKKFFLKKNIEQLEN